AMTRDGALAVALYGCRDERVVVRPHASDLMVNRIEREVFWDNIAHVDDPCGAVSVHAVNGLWGVLALGLFADGTYGAGWNGVPGNVTGLFYGDASQFAAQLVSSGVNFAWAFGGTMILFGLYKRFASMRVAAEVEVR